MLEKLKAWVYPKVAAVGSFLKARSTEITTKFAALLGAVLVIAQSALQIDNRAIYVIGAVALAQALFPEAKGDASS